jgi:Domain of unknown function (DUF4136)
MNIKLTCAVTAVAAVLLSGALAAAKIKVSVQSAPKYDGAGFKTWAWATDGPGQVIMARSSKDDPAPIQKTFGPTIADAITKELGTRGLTAGDVGTADLHAHYYLLIAVGFNTQQFGQFLPAVPEWGIPPFSGGNQAYEIISTGSVVLDLLSTSAKRIVWRGIAQAEIDLEKTDEQRHARIREAMHDLLLKYPKQK